MWFRGAVARERLQDRSRPSAMKHTPTLPSAEAIDTFTGLDPGDRFTAICILDHQGEVQTRARCQTTREGFTKHFARRPRARIALEASSQSGTARRSQRAPGRVDGAWAASGYRQCRGERARPRQKARAVVLTGPWV